MVEWGAIIALFTFILGITFHAGAVSTRVDVLEDWRKDFKHDMENWKVAFHGEMMREFKHIENLIKVSED